MKKINLSLLGFTVLSIAITFIFSHCGSSGSSSLGNIDLSSLPSASAMLKSNGTYGINRRGGISLQTSGTPPYLKDLNSTNALTYFYNGVVTTINNAGSCSASNKNKFWGQDYSTPGPGGMGACMMAQATGEALGRMMDAASTECYIKGMATAAGVPVTGFSQSEMFKAGSGVKKIRVDVTNMPQHGRATMKVFFTIQPAGNTYAYDMYMCQNGSVTSKESLVVDKVEKVMTSTQYNNEGGGSYGYSQATAYLKDNGSGGLDFDISKTRTALSKYTGTWGTYAGKVDITGSDLIKAQRYNSNPTWGKNKTYIVSAFSGAGVDTFAFKQGCFKGQSIPANNSTTWSYSGVTDFLNTFYAALSSSDLSPECDSFSFSSDGVFADTSVPTLDSTGLDCNMDVDGTVGMDFSLASVAAVQEECDGDKRKLANYDMCSSDAVRTAENYCRQ